MVHCSRCETKGLTNCVVPEGDDTCTNCQGVAGQSCDSFGFDDSAIQRVVSRKQQLDKEQREADQALGAALAKVERLRRQRAVLEAEALRMFRKEGEVLAEQERREAVPASSASGIQEYVPRPSFQQMRPGGSTGRALAILREVAGSTPVLVPGVWSRKIHDLPSSHALSLFFCSDC